MSIPALPDVQPADQKVSRRDALKLAAGDGLEVEFGPVVRVATLSRCSYSMGDGEIRLPGRAAGCARRGEPARLSSSHRTGITVVETALRLARSVMR
jgi:hypothetical protein